MTFESVSEVPNEMPPKDPVDFGGMAVSLDAGSVRAIDIQPPFPDPELRVPVTDAMKRNILDPISALLMRVKKSVMIRYSSATIVNVARLRNVVATNSRPRLANAPA